MYLLGNARTNFASRSNSLAKIIKVWTRSVLIWKIAAKLRVYHFSQIVLIEMRLVVSVHILLVSYLKKRKNQLVISWKCSLILVSRAYNSEKMNYLKIRFWTMITNFTFFTFKTHQIFRKSLSEYHLLWSKSTPPLIMLAWSQPLHVQSP